MSYARAGILLLTLFMFASFAGSKEYKGVKSCFRCTNPEECLNPKIMTCDSKDENNRGCYTYLEGNNKPKMKGCTSYDGDTLCGRTGQGVSCFCQEDLCNGLTHKPAPGQRFPKKISLPFHSGNNASFSADDISLHHRSKRRSGRNTGKLQCYTCSMKYNMSVQDCAPGKNACLTIVEKKTKAVMKGCRMWTRKMECRNSGTSNRDHCYCNSNLCNDADHGLSAA